MRTLPRPTRKAGDVFSLCISRVRRPSLKRQLIRVTARVAAAEGSYLSRAVNAQLHLFRRTRTVNGVSAKQLMRVYTGRMVPKTQPGRCVYDELIAAAPYGRCPFCGVGQVATLDHYLPKAKYPVMVVMPVNLVPACSWCQTAKKDAYPTGQRDHPLHPYFDNLEDKRWLCADVVDSHPATFAFKVRRPVGVSVTTAARLRHHLQLLKLDQLFASNAADELINIRFGLERLYEAAGAEAVREHLSTQAESREQAFKNSWQTAMYRAAEKCDWFCDGGFARM